MWRMIRSLVSLTMSIHIFLPNSTNDEYTSGSNHHEHSVIYSISRFHSIPVAASTSGVFGALVTTPLGTYTDYGTAERQRCAGKSLV